MKQVSSSYQKQTESTYTGARARTHTHENYKPISLMKTDVKTLNKILEESKKLSKRSYSTSK